VRSFGRGIFHKEPILGAELGNKRVFRIEPGDLVISNVFAWEGAVAVASKSDSGCIGSHRFMTFTPVDNRITTAWAGWFFKSERGIDLIRRASPGSAGRNRTLAIDRFEALELDLPPIDEQRRTAARLDRLQAAVSSVSDRLEANPPESLLALLPYLIDAMLSEQAPAMKRVAELADFVADRVGRGDDPNPARVFVGPNHIESHTGRRLGSDPLGEDTGPKLRFRPGDVVYLRLRPYLNKVWVADCDGLCSTDQIVMRPKNGLDPNLIAYGLRSSTVLSGANQLTSSLQLPRIRQEQFAEIQVPTDGLDSRRLVQTLNHTRDRVVELVSNRKHQLAGAKALVPSLLNKAFGGLSQQRPAPTPDRR
jgi:hypothetical protein